jgi:leukotriene-A4 hydrolase
MISKLLTAVVATASLVKGGMYNSKDPSTYSNIDEVITEHVNLDWTVDFENRLFDGSTILTMKALTEDVTSVFLDSRGQDIEQVDFQYVHEGCDIWSSRNFTISTPNPNIGDALEVILPYALYKD